MTKEELESSINTLEILLIIFGIFVAVGVTGESVFGFRLWRKNSQVRDIQSAENRSQEREIERLKKESESIRLDTAKATERAANAEREAEQERLARLKIEERLAARRISPEQHRELVRALSQYRGASVELTKLGEFEANRFADDISLTLKDAGWNVILNIVGTVSPPVYGLRCTVNESPAGKALGAAFKALPTVHVESSPNMTVHARIFVGKKPPP